MIRPTSSPISPVRVDRGRPARRVRIARARRGRRTGRPSGRPRTVAATPRRERAPTRTALATNSRRSPVDSSAQWRSSTRTTSGWADGGGDELIGDPARRTGTGRPGRRRTGPGRRRRHRPTGGRGSGRTVRRGRRRRTAGRSRRGRAPRRCGHRRRTPRAAVTCRCRPRRRRATSPRRRSVAWSKAAFSSPSSVVRPTRTGDVALRLTAVSMTARPELGWEFLVRRWRALGRVRRSAALSVTHCERASASERVSNNGLRGRGMQEGWP